MIKQDIISCVLEPGQQIIQAQLSQDYGIGLTPVREALQRLAQQGLVQSVPRVGYVVSPITFSDLQEIFELRLTLESAALRLAILRASDKQLAEIARMANFTYTYHDKASYKTFLARNADFHTSIAIAGGNRRLADAVARVLDELTRVFHLGLDLRDSAEEKLNDHLRLTEALCDRDSDRAQRLIQEEIERSQKRVYDALRGHMGGRVALTKVGERTGFDDSTR